MKIHKKMGKLGFRKLFRDLKTFAEGRKEVSLTINK